jgi:hypothetical protein
MTDLVERVARAIEGEIDNVELVSAAPHVIRALRAKRIARAALDATRHGFPDFRDWGSAREMLTTLGEDAGASDETFAKLSALADWIEQFGPDTLASGKERP